MEIKVNKEDWDYLYKFAQFHRLVTPETCLSKLIELHKECLKNHNK